MDGNKFVRDETDTSLAVRDEIVALIEEVLVSKKQANCDQSTPAKAPTIAVKAMPIAVHSPRVARKPATTGMMGKTNQQKSC
ncbi:MAG: hypothetical protein R3E79_52090 [Caldilineaceae bacterium]